MHKIERDNDIATISKDEKIFLLSKSDMKKTYNVEKNVTLKIYHYNIDCSNNIIINLNGENSNLEYYYSTINYKDNEFKINVNHNAQNTTSNIYNHGVNILNNKLHFDITGQVKKNIENCICNQENQIINLQDGNSTILPILLIDNYNVSSSHSAYIGKFKEDIIFYMMSRGINREKATKLLIKSLLINNGEDTQELNNFKKEIENI